MRRKWLLGGFLIAGLAVALVIGVLVSPFASSRPDGLSRVSIEKGFAETAKTSPIGKPSPVGGYAVKGVSDARISTGLAGGIGVVLTFALGAGVFFGLRALRRREVARGGSPGGSVGTA
jgi:hypothetical protein